MPKLILDGEEIEVAQGTTVLAAALAHGRAIPHYCWHPKLSISGNCRMCLVEVEKSPKLVIACAAQVADGMVVRTETDRVKKARAAMMEFFLINHPLDCPICDQAGECRLQEYAVEHGTGRSRFVEDKIVLNKDVDIGPHVLLDQERCIHCSRCIRFCDEVSKTSELAFFQRGEKTVIGIYPGKRLDNAYSGNVVDLCPVGALTLKEFRFETRVWYLKNTPSVCAACARGCNVLVAVGQQQVLMTTAGQTDDRIKRIVPRPNEDVNSHWICDEGRLSYRRFSAAARLAAAEVPAGNPAEWDGAVAQAAALLRDAGQKKKLAAILSPRLTSEDVFAWRRLVESLGGGRLGVRRIVRGEDDALLVRADKGANAKGAAWILGEAATEAEVFAAAARGELSTLLVVGDPLDPADTAALEPKIRSKIASVVFVGPFVSGAAEGADVRLPAAAWAEEDGTIVNFEGRVQRVRRCHPPRGEGRPGWRVACDLAAAAGAAMPEWTSADEVLAALASAVPEFQGLDAAAIGLLGVSRG
jgi:NADH-quinone oxidoreductase subunit G